MGPGQDGNMADPCLHLWADLGVTIPDDPHQWDYRYEGRCPRTGRTYTLPRTALAKAVARGLMETLANHPEALGEGKMYGVLLVRRTISPGLDAARAADLSPTVGMLKAFSGLWRGKAQWPGWVPPIPGRDQVALQEAHTLDQLHHLKTRLQTLQTLPERATYARLVAEFDQQRQALNQRHRQRRDARSQHRQHLIATLRGSEQIAALEALDHASRGDTAERRAFKHRQTEALAPLATILRAADGEMQDLKRQRRSLSQQLQAAMHRAYRVTNFAGESLTLAQIQALEQPSGLPTGTGDCCAPKLLHYAAQRGWQPLALAEFWWGPPLGDRQSGQFYGACEERCQPLMGFLLGGVFPPVTLTSPPRDVPVLYADDWLVVVDKPAGLLSVPGRYGDRQDSVLTRLQRDLPGGETLRPVHRLDQATSGVLVVARTADSHRHLSQQFAQRQVQKRYEALLEGILAQPKGWVDLPLGPDPAHPPRQRVDGQGKPSQTYFETLTQGNGFTRVVFVPRTGRTHQLRVHAAHPQGLHAPIVGDTLYGSRQPDGEHRPRLHLHATALTLTHPQHQTPLTLTAPVPF